MKICVLDSAFPLNKQLSAGMAVKTVLWQMEKIGIQTTTDPKLADLICISSVHPITAKYANKFKKLNKPIIFGGAGCLSPAYYLNYGDYVILGDGENVFNHIKNKGLKDIELLDNVLVKGKKSVKINQDFPFNAPVIQQEDGAYSIWCGRGCKNKCFFCQTGWALEYQENPTPPIDKAKTLIKNGKKISYLSNDVLQHTFYDKLPKVEHGSYSIKYMAKHGLPPARLIRIGVEGVSERLRAFVNKPISKNDLIKATAWLNQNKKGVRWFMIAGLPSETKEDWNELKDAIMQWKKYTDRGVLELSFTAWCPDPATPLSTCKLDDSYYDNFNEFKEWFFSGIGYSNRIKLYNPQSPVTRLEKAICSMDLSKEELYMGGSLGGNSVVEYPYKTQVLKIIDKLNK